MILQSNLLEGLKIAAGAAAKRATLEILKYVALKGDDGTLQISGTDLEMYVTVSVPAIIEGDFQTTIPAKMFLDLVEKMEDERIDFELDPTRLHIKQNEIEAHIATLPYNEFPLLPSYEGETLYFDVAELISAMKLVEHAAATDQSRPILTGVNFRLEYDKLTLVTADGFRMAVVELEAPNETPQSFTVPVTTIRQVIKMAPKEGTISITVNPSNVCFGLPDTDTIFDAKVYCQLLQDSYVNYKQIIPSNHTCKAEISTKELKNALGLANVMTEDSYCILEIQQDGIAVLSSEGEYGQARKWLGCDVDGEPAEIALNATYVLQAIANIDGNITLETTAGTRPIALKADNYLSVIMPMTRRK